MKEIIPLKKDIIFKTKIGEITSIDLEHNYEVKDEIIEGNVVISGTYKMTEASVLDEEFYYKIPFSIAVSRKIKKDTIQIEIDNFTYDISKDVLRANIDLELTCEEDEESESVTEELKDKEEYSDDDFMQEYFKNETNIEDELDNEINTNIDDSINIDNSTNIDNSKTTIEDNDLIDDLTLNLDNEKTTINNETTNIDLNENINNITNIINSENKYYTYKIYIVRQGDTIETICSKYNVTVNDLKDYNNVNDINVGDKIIIPQINE